MSAESIQKKKIIEKLPFEYNVGCAQCFGIFTKFGLQYMALMTELPFGL